MERQDRMNEAIFLQLNDLEYRVDDIEQDRKPKRTNRSGTGKRVDTVARKGEKGKEGGEGTVDTRGQGVGETTGMTGVKPE